jgi:hypothetical protein
MLTVNHTTAHALEKKERLRVGWTQYRTRALEKPVKCFRCQEFGHVAANCKSAEKRKVACYRCGDQTTLRETAQRKRQGATAQRKRQGATGAGNQATWPEPRGAGSTKQR